MSWDEIGHSVEKEIRVAALVLLGGATAVVVAIASLASFLTKRHK